jgi:hypothetical protein
MDALDYWRLCDELSVVQTALLIVGEDPSETQEFVDNYSPQNRPKGYDATMAALATAIESKRLPAKIVHTDYDEEGVSWHATTIEVGEIRKWLGWKGIDSGFFFPKGPSGPEYLLPSHPNYSAKLAAAVEAWKAVSGNAELRRGKSVKQAISVWLRQHANEFGLTKEDGNPNEQGIDDVSKIANWDTRGGAPKTPGTD